MKTFPVGDSYVLKGDGCILDDRVIMGDILIITRDIISTRRPPGNTNNMEIKTKNETFILKLNNETT